jgi:hypothetical protein
MRSVGPLAAGGAAYETLSAQFSALIASGAHQQATQLMVPKMRAAMLPFQHALDDDVAYNLRVAQAAIERGSELGAGAPRYILSVMCFTALLCQAVGCAMPLSKRPNML